MPNLFEKPYGGGFIHSMWEGEAVYFCEFKAILV